ncbi:MAG: hypothetical protein AAF581_20465 [Planctomycetota bacterium]
MTEGLVQIDVEKAGDLFPRHFNELGIRKIQLSFRDQPRSKRTLAIAWNGGSQGPDGFAVLVDGKLVGRSRIFDSARRPYTWNVDSFDCRLGLGHEHTIEIRALDECRSEIQFTGFRLSARGVPSYQPLCYESVGSLQQYERALGAPGVVIEEAHLSFFAPKEHAKLARRAARFLERAYGVFKELYGRDTPFRFAIENYPVGHPRGWGGISGAATIGYNLEALERFGKLGTKSVRGFVGYTEEMSHGFKGMYRCGGTYEALGVAVQVEACRRLVPRAVADRYWDPKYRLFEATYADYRRAGNQNPDPEKYPWNVFFARILNVYFARVAQEYGSDFWPDFFATLRQHDYPLHRAKKPERLRVYARLLSALFARDVGAEMVQFGIDIDADPPWGWETYGKKPRER